jgi:hypothetical protein
MIPYTLTRGKVEVVNSTIWMSTENENHVKLSMTSNHFLLGKKISILSALLQNNE